ETLALPYLHRDRKQVIDHVGAAIPIALGWLHLIFRIRGARNQYLFSWFQWRLPAEFPKSPGVSRRFADQGRFIPARSSIGAELNSHDFAVTGPGRSVDTHGRVCWNALA